MIRIRASSIKLWQMCPRKYMLQRQYHTHQDSSPALSYGTKVHAEIEDMHNGNIPTSEFGEDLIRLGVPLGERGVRTEVEFEMPVAPYLFHGTIDLLDLRHKSIVRIFDYKTMSQFSNGLNSEQLNDDLQMNFYAWVISQLLPATESVEWCHIQISKKPKEATQGPRRVDAAKSRNAISQWATDVLGPTLRKMSKTLSGPIEDSLRVITSCNAYHKICHLKPACDMVEIKKGLKVLK